MMAGTLAGCSHEIQETTGDPFSEGKYPLQLSAEVNGMHPGSDGKEYWSGDGTEFVGIRMGDNQQVARYLVGSDKASLNPASEQETLQWADSNPSTIKAWSPYNEGSATYDISDQSDGCATFDFLYAEETGSYDRQTHLVFNHQMAKVEYTLFRGDDISDKDLQTAAVTVYGDTQVPVMDGIVAAADQADGEIAVHADGTSGEAIVVPQDMTGKPLFKISINDKELSFIPETESTGNLESGTLYSFTIIIHSDRIEASGISGAWDDQETTGPAEEATTFRVHIPADHGQTLTYAENVTIMDNYLEVDGNQFTISYPLTDDNLMMGFTIAEGLGEVNRTVNEDNTVCTFTCTLRSDVILDYTVYAQPGDCYYSDNTWLPYLDENKTCIGIVFKFGVGADDDASYYGNEFEGNEIRGYAVALQDASPDCNIWGQRGVDIPGLSNEGSFTEKYNGYTNTNVVRKIGNYSTEYWAFLQVDNYQESVATPENTSGWYLPSIGQLADIYSIPDRADKFTAAGGTDFRLYDSYGRYWSSTECSDVDAWYYQFNGNGPAAYGKHYASSGFWCNLSYVRAVLTF